MKRIGIITLFGYHNYGNRLQNYATQHILESMGFSVTTIKNIRTPIKRSFLEKLFVNKGNLKKIILSKFKNTINSSIINKREIKFRNFSKKYIDETNYIISLNNIPKNIEDEFDCFITGSDQVWNPNFSATDIEFLSFVPKKKRISFSASFGVSSLPKDKINYYKEKLLDMSSISVRETSGYEIVKKLTGREAEILVDPTMLLSKDEWSLITTKKNISLKKDYIFIYFLGEITIKNRVWIKMIAKEYNLDIIDVLDMSNQEIYTSDPSEFISLIDNAKLVCTDSFHGSVFSIIMETDFIVFDRIEHNKATMGSRIDTLLEKFELNSRKWHENIEKDEVFNLSFSNSNIILELEKQKAIKFLEKSLND